MLNELIFDHIARAKIKTGVDLLAKAVGTTLGAQGRPVMIEQNGNKSFITKDGVTVAKNIKLEDKFERGGAQSVIEVCKRLLNKVGDGTTTSCVLTSAFLDQFMTENLTPRQMKEMKKYVGSLIDHLKSISIPIDNNENLSGVAYIASNGDEEITSYIKEAAEHVGKDGAILVQRINSSETFVIPESGTLVPFGWGDARYCNNITKQTAEFEDAYILLIDETVPVWTNFVDILQEITDLSPHSPSPIIVVSRGLMDKTRHHFLANILQRRMFGAEIQIAGGSEFMDDLFNDLSLLTGSPLIGDHFKKPLIGPGGIAAHELKRVKYCKITDTNTLIVPYEQNQEKVEEFINYLKERSTNTTDESDKAYITQRISRLSQKVCQIKVGGSTPQIVSEKLDRIEDAVCAVRVAQREGVLPAGGSSFMHLINKIQNDSELDAQIKKILLNSFITFIDKLYANTSIGLNFTSQNYSFEDKKQQWIIKANALQNDDPKTWCFMDIENDLLDVNLFESNLLDATKVITESLAASVEQASLLSRVGAMVAFSDKEDVNSLDMDTFRQDMEQNILRQQLDSQRY